MTLLSRIGPADITVRRSAFDREDLKPYWRLEKKATFL